MLPDAICRPFISAERTPDGWVWQLECDHDLHFTGSFAKLWVLTDAHLAAQCPPLPDDLFDRLFLRMQEAVRA